VSWFSACEPTAAEDMRKGTKKELLELSMSGTKQRCGGKHRYSRKLSKSYRQYEAKGNAVNKKIVFQGSFESNRKDSLEDKSRKDMDDVADGLENLKLQGEVSSQVSFDVKDEWSDTEHSSSPQVSSDLSINASSSSDNDISEDSSASSRNIKEYETNDCDESTDSIDSLNSSAIQQMSEEEALDYIQYLRQKIQKIEAVLQARKKSSCLNKESESKGQNVGCNIAVENSFKYAEKETFGSDEKCKVTSESSKTSIRKDSTAIINNNSKGKSKKPSSYIYSSRIDEEFEYAMSLTKYEVAKLKISRIVLKLSALGSRKEGNVPRHIKRVKELLLCEYSSKYGHFFNRTTKNFIHFLR